MNGRGTFTLSGMVKTRASRARDLAEAEAMAMREPGALTAALNWYRAMPVSNSRDAGRAVKVPSMLIWGDGDVALKEKGIRLTADYVRADYRLEVLEGVSHWILDEAADRTADLLMTWFAAHSGATAL
jgi:pimeloyl-ACP methyl ester carboxylesterase